MLLCLVYDLRILGTLGLSISFTPLIGTMREGRDEEREPHLGNWGFSNWMTITYNLPSRFDSY